MRVGKVKAARLRRLCARRRQRKIRARIRLWKNHGHLLMNDGDLSVWGWQTACRIKWPQGVDLSLNVSPVAVSEWAWPQVIVTAAQVFCVTYTDETRMHQSHPLGCDIDQNGFCDGRFIRQVAGNATTECYA